MIRPALVKYVSLNVPCVRSMENAGKKWDVFPITIFFFGGEHLGLILFQFELFCNYYCKPLGILRKDRLF